ncbi:hypothetical protein P7C70_g6083, partial [Phenoliferia sp. Uapishka_3]
MSILVIQLHQGAWHYECLTQVDLEDTAALRGIPTLESGPAEPLAPHRTVCGVLKPENRYLRYWLHIHIFRPYPPSVGPFIQPTPTTSAPSISTSFDSYPSRIPVIGDMRTASASTPSSSPRRRGKGLLAIARLEGHLAEHDGPRRIPLACGHCRSREQNAIAKARKQNSRVAKGTKKALESSPRKEGVKKRSRVRLSGVPLSPASTRANSVDASESSWSISRPAPEDQQPALPSALMSPHSYRFSTSSSFTASRGHRFPSLPQASNFPEQSMHAPSSYHPSSPISPTWPISQSPSPAWGETFEQGHLPAAQWQPSTSMSAYQFPEPRQLPQGEWAPSREVNDWRSSIDSHYSAAYPFPQQPQCLSPIFPSPADATPLHPNLQHLYSDQQHATHPFGYPSPEESMLTSVAICSTSILLGVLFTSLLFDSAVLFGSKGPISPEIIGFVESYYLTWWDGAMAVKMFLHVVLLIDYVAVVSKFARYTDTTFFFSGGSLLLLILNTSLYITVTVPYIRLLARDPLNARGIPFDGSDMFTRIQSMVTKGNTGPLGDSARASALAEATKAAMTFPERLEHVSVLCAANTINIALLVGVVLLQIGEWYTEETLVKPIEEESRKYEAARAAAVPVPVTEEKKTQ